MDERTTMPPRLRRLALTWLIVGIFSMLGAISLAIDLGWGAMNVGILGFAFSPGLALGWRWVTRAIRWISWITIILTFIVVVNGVSNLTVLGWVGAGAGVVVILLLLEQLYILKLPEVRRYHESIIAAQRSSP